MPYQTVTPVSIVEIGGTPINRFVSIDVAVEFEDSLIRQNDKARKFWCLGETIKKVVCDTQTPVFIVLI